MKVFKLTDEKHETFNAMKWGEGVEHQLPRKYNPSLCSKKVIHFYRNMNLGLILNPIHGKFSSPVIWEAEAAIVVEDWDKAGGFYCRTIRIIPTPEWYTDDKKREKVYVQFSVLCAEFVLPIFEEKFPRDRRPREAIEEAKIWLANLNEKNIKTVANAAEDHCASLGDPYITAAALKAAADAAYAASTDAAYAIDVAAMCAADSASYAAKAAAQAATNVAAAESTTAATNTAATIAAKAANTASAHATRVHTANNDGIDFKILADQAVEIVTRKEKK